LTPGSCAAASLVTRATSKAMCQVLGASLQRYGIPDEILTDNGNFTGRFGPRGSGPGESLGRAR